MVDGEGYQEREYVLKSASLNQEQIWPENSFLAENPEAFGLVPDACPLATKHFLIAANGHAAEGGGASTTHGMECASLEELHEIYGEILPKDSESDTVLSHAFGSGGMMREQPVSRYCAVLAELTALRVLNNLPDKADFKKALAMLNDELSWVLHAFRRRFEDLEQVEVIRDAAFEPTVCVCRIQELGGSDYTVDVFSAGDFRVYLLDEQGMAPLWSAVTPAFSCERGVGLTGRSVRLHHPAPFAVLLVSESICALNAAEYRSLRNDSGLVWRYRMRLEDFFLRLITDCVRDHEFGERAAHFFVGRSHGRDSASGAMAIMRDGVSYETFHLQCQNRLSVLGRQMELLPNGYNPRQIPEPASRLEIEYGFLQNLLNTRADLNDRLTNALRVEILKKYEQGDGGETYPLPEDAPDYARLNRAEIRDAILRLDQENYEDRGRIEKNRGILQESLAEHWITLRPLLTASVPSEETAVRGYREVNDQIYEACLDMNRRLAEMKERRRRMVEEIRALMTNSLEVAEADGEDWIGGRAGWESVSAWMEPLQRDLPARLARMRAEWQADTEGYRGLLAAYTAQREDLFRRDVRRDGGVFFDRWTAILEGGLPESVWDEWKACLIRDPERERFGAFLDALRQVSCGTGILMARIRARAVENRAARELANRADLRLNALRGAAYEDPDWGEGIISVMDSAARGDFRGAIRRWQEDCKRIEQQREAFERYSAMYEAYRS